MAKGKYQEWLTPEGLLKIEGWKRDGLSDEQVAENMGIGTTTLYRWEQEHEEFREALKKGREVVVRHLENTLIKRASGYDIEETIYFQDKNGGVNERKTIKHIPPDTTALIFALKNMSPNNWRDRKETALSGNLQTIPSKLTFVCSEDKSNGCDS